MVPSKIMCDCCGVEIDDKSPGFDEFIHIRHSCGYESETFGDLNHIEVDLCQHCAFKILHPFVRLREHAYGGNDATREKALPFIEACLNRQKKRDQE